MMLRRRICSPAPAGRAPLLLILLHRLGDAGGDAENVGGDERVGDAATDARMGGGARPRGAREDAWVVE